MSQSTIALSAIAKGIHNGASTHHQDQVIYLVNFNPINKICNISKKVIPCDVFFSDLKYLSFCIFFLFTAFKPRSK